MADRLGYRVYQILWSTLDWVFPPKCGGCGKIGARWCSHCQANVQVISGLLCPLCGQLMAHHGVCSRCQKARPHYTALRSWAVFEGNIRNAIHQLKYKRNVGLGDVLALSMIGLYRHLEWEADLITPVPLGLARLAERGYNQSSLLARPLSLALNLPYRPEVLNRSRETRSQVGLTTAERRLNVAGAFIAQSKLAARRRILVVDDVTTSGSTLEACADALINAGAHEIYCLTLARAVFKVPLLMDQPIHES